MGSNPTLSARPRSLRVLALVLFFITLSLILPVRAAVAQSTPLRLGIGNYVEEKILGRLTEAFLKARGIPVEVQSGLAPEVLRDRAMDGELDLFWGYTGRALIVFHKNPDRAVLRDPLKCHQAVSRTDLKAGLFWGRMAAGNNSFGLVMRADRAAELNISTISDLAAGARKIYKTSKKKTVLGLEAGFKRRPDGLGALLALFGFEYNSIMTAVTVPDRILDSLRTKETQAVVGPTVDGRINRFKLTVLKEDKPFFPSYNPAPVWRQGARESYPQAVAILDGLAARLNLQALNDLRFPVEIHGHDPVVAARDWLEESGLAD